MHTLTETDIRRSLINCSKKETASAHLPDLDAISFETIDYLGWRDVKAPQRAFIVLDTEDGPAGIMMRLGDARPTSRPMCNWCQDVHLKNDVRLWSAQLAGPAGRNGNTIATYVCEGFECSANVRRKQPINFVGFDPEADTQARIQGLRERSRAFIAAVNASR